MKNGSYDNNSISSLKGPDQVRQRPAVIFGTNDIQGCAHSVFEIIANAIDEAREGFGNRIEIVVQEDNTVSVRDYGRGVPMDWNESEGKFNWELVFCTLYASGKYDSSSYAASLGLNGLGATATQYASEFMVVESIRDGKKYTIEFEKGEPIGELQIDKSNEPSGTKITFKPDKEVFTDVNIPIEYYVDTLRRQAMLHDGLEIVLKFHGKSEIILKYPNGASDFIDIIAEKRFVPSTISFKGQAEGCEDEWEDNEVYKVNMGVTLTLSRDTNLIEMYHNGSFLSDGGSSYDAMSSAITKVIEDYAKKVDKISRTDKIIFKDVEELLVLVGYTECPAHKTYFKNQTKTAINNKLIKSSYYDFLYHNMKRWLDDNRTIADRIVAEVLVNKQAREQADAIKKKVIRKLSTSVDTIQGRPSKFKECASKNPWERELYIVEGDSAAGACLLARNGKFQAIMPVRGKIMNCLKEDLTRILNSEIIVDLIRVLGCGIEAESKYVKDLPKFDLTKLSFNKIIICTDADLDGMQIRCLIITMIYRLMPTLLKSGKVFIAETPLFEITTKDDTYFAFNEAEKVNILNNLVASGVREGSIKIQRSKGLGENDPEMMSISTMRPDTRRLIPVEYGDDDQGVATLFYALLGDDIENRRYLIEQYFDMDVDID